MTIKDEYLLIKGNKEAVSPDEIVSWAEGNPNSEFYSRLEWDNAKAGHAYRIWQVRALLAIHVKTNSNVREIVSLSIDRKNGGYRLLDEVMQSETLRLILINDALGELVRIRNKHRHITELAKVWSEIDSAAEVSNGAAA